MMDIEILHKIGKVVRFEENQMVFMQNDPGDTMYFALKGAFGVYINSFDVHIVPSKRIPPHPVGDDVHIVPSKQRIAPLICHALKYID